MMKPIKTDFEPIQEYPNYIVGWAVLNGVRLYPTTQSKVRTDVENKRIIAAQQKKISPLTELEKTQCKKRVSKAEYIPDSTIKKIRKLKSNGVAEKNISAMFSISKYYVKQIVNREIYDHVK